jgi:hypothetical protein
MNKRLTLLIGMIGLAAMAFGQLSTGPAAGGAGTTGLRYALVIGNSAYQHTSRLADPANDASDVGQGAAPGSERYRKRLHQGVRGGIRRGTEVNHP